MAVLRVIDSRLKYLLEAHRAEAVERNDPPPEQTRHDACLDAAGELIRAQVFGLQVPWSGSGGA